MFSLGCGGKTHDGCYCSFDIDVHRNMDFQLCQTI